MAKNYGTENKTNIKASSKNEMNSKNVQDCGKNYSKNSVKNYSQNKSSNAYDSEHDDYSDRY